MRKILCIDYHLFRELEQVIIKTKNDSDRVSFTEIKNILNEQKIVSPDQFAIEVIYVILASGFKQKTAKIVLDSIINFINNNKHPSFDDLIKIFKNKNKIEAIIDIWDNRIEKQKQFYCIKDDDEKIEYLGTLKYIGNITRNHLARNLGMNLVKYDIWIQKLGVGLYGDKNDIIKINNSKLSPVVKDICDKMFFLIEKDTGEKRGYIDVVLWKSCQLGIIKIKNDEIYYDDNYK
jgi:hypothetical protein